MAFNYQFKPSYHIMFSSSAILIHNNHFLSIRFAAQQPPHARTENFYKNGTSTHPRERTQLDICRLA